MRSKDTIMKSVIERLETIYDPEIPVNIYALGLIYKIELIEQEDGYFCDIEMTLTSPGCPVAENLLEQVANISSFIEEISYINVDLVFDPPWNPQEMLSYEVKLELGIL